MLPEELGGLDLELELHSTPLLRQPLELVWGNGSTMRRMKATMTLILCLQRATSLIRRLREITGKLRLNLVNAVVSRPIGVSG